MKSVLIIGGGLAGLTAASILSSKKYLVTILEASPKLGGRAYSFIDADTNSVIDNGQHILMGCYRETLAFLNLIGGEKNLDYQKNLEINFLSKDRLLYSLKAEKLIYPFNLLYAIFNYDVFEIDEKIKVISFIIKLPFQSKKSFRKLNVKEWLDCNGQSSNTIKMFWEILCVGAMNTSLENASALYFQKILIEIFFKGNFASTILLPKFGLSESIISPSINFILHNDGRIILSEQVNKLCIHNSLIQKVTTSKNSYSEFEYVVAAVPLHSLEKLIDLNEVKIKPEFEYSTIVNIHIWSDEFNLEDKFYGLLDSPLHWIFRKEDHINIVISDADYLVEKSKEEIFNFVIEELLKFINFNPSKIKSYKILKEKRATFIPSNKILSHRPKSKTKIKNLLLAGDWIDTDLPATIESAIKSGRLAAEEIISLSI